LGVAAVVPRVEETVHVNGEWIVGVFGELGWPNFGESIPVVLDRVDAVEIASRSVKGTVRMCCVVSAMR